LEEKVYTLISLIFDLIFGILLYVSRNDSSKTAAINSIDKFVNSIFNIFIFFKDACSHKKEANGIAEPEKEISLCEEGKVFLNEIGERKKL